MKSLIIERMKKNKMIVELRNKNGKYSIVLYK